MKKIIRLTESQLKKIISDVISESTGDVSCLKGFEHTPSGQRGGPMGAENYSGDIKWEGKNYYGKFFLDGAVRLYDRIEKGERWGEWICSNGKLSIKNLSPINKRMTPF